MLYPVCPTCHFLLADKQLIYEEKSLKIQDNEKLSENQKQKEIEKLLKKIGLKNYCCKMRMISYLKQEEIII